MSNETACQCCSGQIGTAVQSFDEMDFERGLWKAALDGDIQRTQKLLDCGQDSNVADTNGYCPLHYAARNGHLDCCNLLLQAGAFCDVMTRSGHVTPLQKASYHGHISVIDLLIKHGAQCLHRDIDGNTALHKAAENNQKKACEILIVANSASKFMTNKNGKLPIDLTSDIELKTLLTANCKQS